MLDTPKASKMRYHTPLEHITQLSQRVAQICDLLEALADDLPRRPAPVWREATHMCSDVIPQHYRNVLGVLLPLLRRRTRGERDCEELLARLQADFEDEANRLSELKDLMTEAIGAPNAQIGSEALGYALRGFFGALRRNTAWERDVLLPLAKRRFNDRDLSEIAQILNPPTFERLH